MATNEEIDQVIINLANVPEFEDIWNKVDETNKQKVRTAWADIIAEAMEGE